MLNNFVMVSLKVFVRLLSMDVVGLVLLCLICDKVVWLIVVCLVRFLSDSFCVLCKFVSCCVSF